MLFDLKADGFFKHLSKDRSLHLSRVRRNLAEKQSAKRLVND